MNELQPQRHNDLCLDMGLLVSLRDGELSAEEIAQTAGSSRHMPRLHCR